MPEKSIQSLLASLGFTAKETQIYLAIQKQGKVAPTDLAELTRINRTTVYSVIKELIKKGVIIEDLGSPKKEIIATPPEDLLNIIQNQRVKLDEQQTSTEQAIAQIKQLAGEATYPVPKIQFIKEDRLESFLYERTPIWDQSMLATDVNYLGFQEPLFVEHYEKWIDWYWQRAPEAIKLRLLSNVQNPIEAKMTQKQYAQRQIIFWKGNVNFGSTTWVMGDFVVMIVLSSSPNYLVEIHDARLAQDQRTLFAGILEDIAQKQNQS